MESQIVIDRVAVKLRWCRLNDMSDREAAVAILAVVDSCDVAHAATEDDMTTVKRIGHGMQRGDTQYCLAELAKARIRRVNT